MQGLTTAVTTLRSPMTLAFLMAKPIPTHPNMFILLRPVLRGDFRRPWWSGVSETWTVFLLLMQFWRDFGLTRSKGKLIRQLVLFLVMLVVLLTLLRSPPRLLRSPPRLF